ncbi:MAG: PA14 domain-containing protein [Myxococcota bacterium]
MSRHAWVAALLCTIGFGCNETGLSVGPPPDPATPPERELDLWGKTPTDWQGCYGGLRGMYYNLTPAHPDVEVLLADERDPDAPAPGPDSVDWFDGKTAFQRYDASTDFGPNWWPVNGGFQDDPQYFAARWVGWLRVTRRGDHDIVVGGSSDVWVKLDDDVVVNISDAEDFETSVRTVNLNTGVYKLDVYYAHRLGETNGFRFRVASEDVIQCYPLYGDGA